MRLEIPRCYDSHVHFLATGLFDPSQSLNSLKAPTEISMEHFSTIHSRGEWLTGFGWDQFNFRNEKLPHRKDLAHLATDQAILLSRADGHAAWLNEKALQLAGLWKSKDQFPQEFVELAEFDSDGWPTGILYENAMYFVYGMIPSLSAEQKKSAYLKSQQIFESGGFTHIRDMECNAHHFQVLKKMEDEKLLSLYVEENFNLEKIHDLDALILEALQARKEPSQQLRVLGIKFYLDGALGSEGAWVSEAYGQESPQTQKKFGFCLWEEQQIEEILIKTWEQKLSVAVHALGDQASKHLLRIATRLKNQRSISGPLHLEHVEILQDESIAMMKNLEVRCHLQPCHWLTDRKWLREKQKTNWKLAFPIARLRKAQIPFSFGSDSPIEPPSIENNRKALVDLEDAGISGPVETWWTEWRNSWWQAHSHPDTSWGPKLSSVFEMAEGVHFSRTDKGC